MTHPPSAPNEPNTHATASVISRPFALFLCALLVVDVGVFLVPGPDLQAGRVNGLGIGGALHVGDVEAADARGGPVPRTVEVRDRPRQAAVGVVLEEGEGARG